jgi:hypothetical protein
VKNHVDIYSGEDQLTTITLRTPYLLFIGSETEPIYAKTAAGLAKWRPESCMGQLSLEGGTIDLGLPKHSLASAAEAGAKSLVIGTSAVGLDANVGCSLEGRHGHRRRSSHKVE